MSFYDNPTYYCTNKTYKKNDLHKRFIDMYFKAEYYKHSHGFMIIFDMFASGERQAGWLQPHPRLYLPGPNVRHRIVRVRNLVLTSPS